MKEEGGHSWFRGWLSRNPLLVCFSTAEKKKELIWMSLQGIIRVCLLPAHLPLHLQVGSGLI